jgi:hypothetical protein
MGRQHRDLRRCPRGVLAAQLAAKNLSAEMLARQRHWHALPDGWENMDYPGFLAARRKLMGQVVRDAYARLHEHE